MMKTEYVQLNVALTIDDVDRSILIPHNEIDVLSSGVNRELYRRYINACCALLGCQLSFNEFEIQEIFDANVEEDYTSFVYDCQHHRVRHVIRINDEERPCPLRMLETLDPEIQCTDLPSLEMKDVLYYGFYVDPYGVAHSTAESDVRREEWMKFRQSRRWAVEEDEEIIRENWENDTSVCAETNVDRQSNAAWSEIYDINTSDVAATENDETARFAACVIDHPDTNILRGLGPYEIDESEVDAVSVEDFRGDLPDEIRWARDENGDLVFDYLSFPPYGTDNYYDETVFDASSIVDEVSDDIIEETQNQQQAAVYEDDFMLPYNPSGPLDFRRMRRTENECVQQRVANESDEQLDVPHLINVVTEEEQLENEIAHRRDRELQIFVEHMSRRFDDDLVNALRDTIEVFPLSTINDWMALISAIDTCVGDAIFAENCTVEQVAMIRGFATRYVNPLVAEEQEIMRASNVIEEDFALNLAINDLDRSAHYTVIECSDLYRRFSEVEREYLENMATWTINGECNSIIRDLIVGREENVVYYRGNDPAIITLLDEVVSGFIPADVRTHMRRIALRLEQVLPERRNAIHHDMWAEYQRLAEKEHLYLIIEDDSDDETTSNTEMTSVDESEPPMDMDTEQLTPENNEQERNQF